MHRNFLASPRLSLILLCLLLLSSLRSVWARGGDSIRSDAPTVALFLDMKDGNFEPLEDAYFEKGIDYFLDIEAPRTEKTRALYNLREVGRAIRQKNFAVAEQRWAAVRGWNHEKTYLRGVLDAAEGKYQPALENFRKLIDNRKVLTKNLRALAFLGAARVFHEIDDYAQALYHFNQIRQLSPYFFESVFEKSWSFYQDGDMNGALGATLAFMSPYFENAFYPETYLVRAGAFYQLCYFERANLTIERFKRDFEPIRLQLADLLKRDPSGFLYDERILKSMHPRIVGGMIADDQFRSLMKAELAVRDEIKNLRGSSLQTAQYVQRFLRGRLAYETRRVLANLDKQIMEVLAQMDLIQIDILQSGVNQLMGLPREEDVKVKIMNLGDVDFDEMVQFWPFKGEFWLDEIGSFYYGLKSNCENGTPAANLKIKNSLAKKMSTLTLQVSATR